MAKALILHVTDPHFFEVEPSALFHDHKVKVTGLKQDSREEIFGLTLELLSKRLQERNEKIDAVIFTGDAQDRNSAGGHTELREQLLKHLAICGVRGDNIVATPGNHDVNRELPVNDKERFKEFMKTWRDNEAITPWIDGEKNGHGSKHRFEGPEKLFEIYPLNSSHWAQTTLTPSKGVSDLLPSLQKRFETKIDPAEFEQAYNELILPQMRRLASADIARVSPEQLDFVRNLISQQKPKVRPLRIVALHHHLIAPSVGEEFRPFADITNLSLLRAFLRQNEIDIVVHGHKHVENLTYDYIYPSDGPLNLEPHRMMVISGGALDTRRGDSPLRIIRLSGMPGAPEVEVETIPLAVRGLNLEDGPRLKGRVWRTNHAVSGGPVIITGNDIDEVYSRAVRAAHEEAQGGMLIVHLDLEVPKADEKVKRLPFPDNYPDPDGEKPGDFGQDWVQSLVSWWQLSRSVLEERIPYIHGTRLERFAGKFNQMNRLVALLKQNKSTSRGIATLIDPTRDFTADGSKEDFASFCFIQFKWRSDGSGSRNLLDCIGYYRAQEFKHWWPINVAELRELQMQVASAVDGVPGRITTIAADARAVFTRTPGQVAVPTIDRWLDQAPEKLAGLSMMLSGVPLAIEQGLDRTWSEFLADQEAAADPSNYNPEGVPVAVDGLRMLEKLISQFSPEDEHTIELRMTLRNLAEQNEWYEKSSRDRAAYDKWAPVASHYLKKLQALTNRTTAPSRAPKRRTVSRTASRADDSGATKSGAVKPSGRSKTKPR